MVRSLDLRGKGEFLVCVAESLMDPGEVSAILRGGFSFSQVGQDPLIQIKRDSNTSSEIRERLGRIDPSVDAESTSLSQTTTLEVGFKKGSQSAFVVDFLSISHFTSISFEMAIRHPFRRKGYPHRRESLHTSCCDAEKRGPFGGSQDVGKWRDESADGSNSHAKQSSRPCRVGDVLPFPHWQAQGEKSEERHAAALDQEPEVGVFGGAGLVG